MSEIEQLASLVEKRSKRDFTPTERSMADDLEGMLCNWRAMAPTATGRACVALRDEWQNKIAPRLDALIRGRGFDYIFDGKHPLTMQQIERMTGGTDL